MGTWDGIASIPVHMADPKDAKVVDARVLTCGNILWEAAGKPAPQPPVGLRLARDSARFVNLGKKSWPLVTANKPCASGAWATACPVGTGLAQEATPCTQDFAVRTRNLYGQNVASIRWRFLVYTGTAAGTSDRSIVRLEIQTLEASLSWGWTANLKAVVDTPLEYADQGAEVAVLPVRLELTLTTKVKDESGNRGYLACADGVFPL